MTIKQFCIDVANITIQNLKYCGYFTLGFAGILMFPGAIMHLNNFIANII